MAWLFYYHQPFTARTHHYFIINHQTQVRLFTLLKMKTSLALLAALLAAVTHAAPASNDDISWYSPVQNVTCTGHADGRITCQQSEIEPCSL